MPVTYVFKRPSTGKPIEADVYYNKNTSDVPKAIVLLYHGGGFVIGDKSMLPKAQIEALIELDFVVIAPNYRLCPTISLFDGPYLDARDAYRWAINDLPSVLSKDAGVLIDTQKTAVIGYSAGGLLVHLLASETNPPKAILDFYGPKYLNDSFWHSPLPALREFQEFDKAFLDEIYQQTPAPSFTNVSLERRAPSGGLPSFDFSKPRNAWLFASMKHGYQFEKAVGDGNYDRVDPAKRFTTTYPPTCFIHGTADDMVDARFSQQAYEELKELGVVTELVLISDKSHAFDSALKPEDPLFQKLTQGFSFLKTHVDSAVKTAV